MTTQHDKADARLRKSKTGQERYIKVNQSVYTYTIRDKNHRAYDQHIEQAVPWINIKGKWLQQAGFDINRPVKIRVMDGCLVLTIKE